MQKLAPATEQFQHFVSNLRESFWGDLNGKTREAWQKFFEADSERQRDRFAVVDAYERNAEQRRDYRNGYYERDFVTVLGTLRLRQAPLTDDWAYLFLDGVNLKVRRESGRKCVQMLVAYGVRQDGRRELLSFMRSQGESQGAWEGLLNDLYQRGLRGKHLQLIITDGCPGLAGAIQTIYPRVLHQRCWVHKMRNIREKGRKRDRDELKQMAQAIYLAANRKQARAAFRSFKLRWQPEYPTMVKQLEKDLPDLLAFFSFPKHLWKQLRTTNIIERCFVEVRRRTRPMVCFVNVKSVDRIIYSIFYRFNLEWKTRTLEAFTQAA